MTLENQLTIMFREWLEILMRRTMHNFFLYTKENNLSMSQMGALLRLHNKGMCAVSDIGDDLEITNAAASQMLDRLVQQGLIERTEDPNDRRVKRISLTDEGYHVVHAGIQARQSWLHDFLQLLTPDEQEQLLAAMNLVIDKVRQLNAQSQDENDTAPAGVS